MDFDAIYLMAITVILIFAGLINKNSRFLFCLQSLWMYTLMAGNTKSMDMNTYEIMFLTAQSVDMGLYGYFCVLASQINFSFIGMNAILCIFIVAIMIYIIRKYTRNWCFVMSLYFIYPLIDSIIQKRFFTAFSLVSLAIVFFLLKKGFINKLIFICLIVIAGLIHQSAYIYIVFLLVPFLKKTSKKKIALICIFTLSLIVTIYMPSILSTFWDQKAELYFLTLHDKIKYPIINFILWMGFHFGFIYFYRLFYLNCQQYIVKSRYFDFIKNVYYLNLCSIVLIPLYYWEPTFFRFYRCLILFNYIAISSVLPGSQSYYKPLLYSAMTYLLYTIVAFICIYFFASAGYKEIIEPIFIGNILMEI